MPDIHHYRQHPHLNRVFGVILRREYLWHINRRSVSVAVAIGLFCALMPVPVQMLLAAASAIILRANLPLAVIVVWITNPFTATPIFYFCYKFGQLLLSLLGQLFYYESSFQWLNTGFSTAWQPLLLGCLVLGALAAALGYFAVHFLWRYHITFHWRRRNSRYRLMSSNTDHAPLNPAAESTASGKRAMLIHIAIPKTGSTTFALILQKKINGRLYSLKSVFFTPGNSALRDFLTLSSRKRDHFDAIIGHMPPGIDDILMRPCAYTTMLRDPLDRLISFYYHAKRRPHNRFYKMINSDKLTLEQFIAEKAGKNSMTKWILGFDLLDEEWSWQRLDEIKASGVEMLNTVQRSWERPITATMLERAKTKLREQFMLVGVTEKFSEFIFLLAQELGWKTVPNYRRRNQSLLRPCTLELDANVITRFQEHNGPDLELYTYARQLFQKKWDELSALQKQRANHYQLSQEAVLHAEEVNRT